MRREKEFAKLLNERLTPIGWQITASGLVPADENVGELFFPMGSQHDAYVDIRRIFSPAQASIDIVDPWMNESVFQILATSNQTTLNIRLLTSNTPPDFMQECLTFQQQYSSIRVDVRLSREFHDRFLVIDGKNRYHIGASIKDAGRKAFMINQIEDGQNAKALITQIEQSWAQAQTL